MPITSVRQFLRELVRLAGQEDADNGPVLELQIADVMSKTTVEMIDGSEYLVVAASLPATEQSNYLHARAEEGTTEDDKPGGTAISWNAGARCYVVTRRTRARDLRDDRSVMDAILSTVDEAIGWRDVLAKVYPR